MEDQATVTFVVAARTRITEDGVTSVYQVSLSPMKVLYETTKIDDLLGFIGGFLTTARGG